MTSKTKHSGGPKTDKGKAISSRNSTTHGLTARRWINANEQSLFDETVEAFNNDFDPQTSIEKVLIVKMAECTVRLMRIQNSENAMFDLASSEAAHPEDSINSLSNNNEDLTQAVKNTSPLRLQFNADDFNKKTDILDQIKQQTFNDILDWDYLESSMPIVASYIVQKCTDENLKLHNLISRKSGQSGSVRIEIIGIRPGDKEEKVSPPPIVDIMENAHKISSSSLQKYLDNLAHNITKDLQVQYILKDLDQRTQQIKDAAIPDTQKLSLIQRYRTADERQFSKTLGELLELQKRRKTI
jgi:hypothetical protein